MKVEARTPLRKRAVRQEFGAKAALHQSTSYTNAGKSPTSFQAMHALAAVSTCLRRWRKTPDLFQLNSLVAQVLFVQLHAHTQAQYDSQNGTRRRSLQTGEGRRSFSKLFEPLSAIELVRLFENLLRFTNDEAHAPARAFFLAYAPLSFEHDVSGSYIGPGVWTPEAGSRTAALRVRHTLKRWCDWLEALVHFQVHQWHHWNSANLELDKAIIFLWPLLKRHEWSYGDLLQILRSQGTSRDLIPCQSVHQLAAYCQSCLGLRCRTLAKAFQMQSQPGRAVAERVLKFLPAIG
jgi:hypothetical protein